MMGPSRTDLIRTSRSRPIHVDTEHPVAHPRALKPFDPGRLPFYYGWVVMVVSALGIIFSIPGQTMGVSVFTDHLIDALGLTRIRISTAYMVGTLASSLLMTRAGRLYDRLGARTTGAGAIVLLAGCLVFLSQVDVVAGGVAGLFGAGGSASWVAGFAMVSLGFLGIRFFGQGVLTLVSRTMMMRWFEERRGRVSAWSGIVVSGGFALAPLLLQMIIEGRGWRGAWMVLALLLLLTALPMVLVLFRDTPERCGIRIEQGLRHLSIHKKKLEHAGADATLREARRDGRYWAYTLMLAWYSLYSTAFTFHVVDIFASRGVDASHAVAIFMPITVITIIFSFLGSWASDAIDLPPLFFLTVFGYILVGLGIMYPGAGWSSWVLIGGQGLASGIWGVLNNVSMPRLFGREHLGEIAGSVMAFMVAGSAMGPWLFSVLRTSDGSYTPAGLLGIIGPLLLAGFGAFAFYRSAGKKGADESTSTAMKK